MASSGRILVRQMRAQERKRRWRPLYSTSCMEGLDPAMSTVMRSVVEKSLPWSARYRLYATTAIPKPPRSPIFSPRVNLPFTPLESVSASTAGTLPSNCVTSFPVSSSKAVRSLSDHQELRLPSPSYWLPWSSNPWPISWPITAPIAPKLVAASASGE